MKTLKQLSDLHEETQSNIQLHLAIDALESGDLSKGIQALYASAQYGKNAAALYNLGLCFEQGLGVEENQAKVH
jgi:TPR repeat protein